MFSEEWASDLWIITGLLFLDTIIFISCICAMHFDENLPDDRRWRRDPTPESQFELA